MFFLLEKRIAVMGGGKIRLNLEVNQYSLDERNGSMNTIERITQYLKEHRDELVQDMRFLASIPSVLGPAQPGAPFGRECARCLEASAQLFRSYGFDTTVYPDSGYAFCRYGAREGKYLGIFGHSDVVPVTPEDWLMTQPFEILEKDGVLYGRGVSDNKSGVLASLYILRALRELEIPLKNGLGVFIGSNEESGMGDIKHFVKEQPLPEASLIPDSGFPFSLGERGILRLKLKNQQPAADVLELQGGQNYNTVMPSLRCVLRKTPELLGFIASQKREWLKWKEQEDSILLEISGISSHAAAPEKGFSALKRLSNLLIGCECLDANDHAQFVAMAHAIEDCNGKMLGIYDVDPVLGTLTCANGMVWMEDGCIVFTLDIRFGTTISSEQVVQGVKDAVAADGFSVEVNYDARAFALDPEAPLALAMKRAYCEATGAEDCQGFYMSGGTYCKHLPNAYATGTCIRLNDETEVEPLPQGHGGAHQADERIVVDHFINGIAVLAQMALTLDQEI